MRETCRNPRPHATNSPEVYELYRVKQLQAMCRASQLCTAESMRETNRKWFTSTRATTQWLIDVTEVTIVSAPAIFTLHEMNSPSVKARNSRWYTGR